MAASGNEYVLIDTSAFDAAIAKRQSLESQYADIVSTYEGIIKSLDGKWKGDAANAFFADAKTIGTNIKGIADILSTMCNTLEDCRSVIQETDKALGDGNRSGGKQ